MTAPVPIRKPTTYSTPIESQPAHAQIGTTSSASARPMSDQTMIGSFGARSISTPAKRPKSANGIDSSAVSTPISKGVAFKSSAAVSGSARKVIWPPKCVIVSEVHNRTKSALRHNPLNTCSFFWRDCASRVARDGGIGFWLPRSASKFPAGDRPAGSVFAGAHTNRAAQRQAEDDDLGEAVHRDAQYSAYRRSAPLQVHA